MSDKVRHHRDRAVDSPGDNLLDGFASVVDALRCAQDVQQVPAQRNSALPENRRMNLPIGINFGDVIDENNRFRRKPVKRKMEMVSG